MPISIGIVVAVSVVHNPTPTVSTAVIRPLFACVHPLMVPCQVPDVDCPAPWSTF